MKLTAILCMAFLSSACASTGIGSGSLPKHGVPINSAAYGADSFTFDKPMPSHEVDKIDFYFKNCGVSSSRSHYSKTDYECKYP
jgi:hypothetical protein